MLENVSVEESERRVQPGLSHEVPTRAAVSTASAATTGDRQQLLEQVGFHDEALENLAKSVNRSLRESEGKCC